MQLSVIVPVYNVASYIRPCLESILRQGLSDNAYEIILVNDGTQDDSFEQIADLMVQHPNIMRIDQENQGLSAARNTGMLHACGTYVLFVDSDDLIVEGSVPVLLSMAEREQADLVVAEFIKLADDEILTFKTMVQPEAEYVRKSGSQLFLEDLNPSENYVWRTLYRRLFLEDNHLRFIPGICYEDMPFTPECYLKAQVCVRTSCPLYIYRMGHSSITASMSAKKAMDMNKGIARLWQLKDMEGLKDVERQRLQDNLFATFSFLLWCVSHNKHVLDRSHEIVSDLKQRVPDLWFSNGMKQWLVSAAFRYVPYLYLKLRSL